MRMFNPADLPDTIPVFPLPGALLLPHARLPLNIFEPRYLAMLEDAVKTPHRLIGMVQPLKDGPSGLHSIGCAGRVVAFSETDDGRYMITLGGVSRFRMVEIQDGFEPYFRATVDWSEFTQDVIRAVRDDKFDREQFMETLGRYFQTTGLTSDWDNLKKAEEELLVNSLSMLCPFDIEDKQALLEAATLKERRETLLTLMDFVIASGGEEGKVQ